MLIDTFAANWLGELDEIARQASPSNRQYLLIDGAFVPGIHRRLARDRKHLLFGCLPGSTEEVLDVSPFLTPIALADKDLKLLLSRCNQWPMVSLIQTTESLEQLAMRLSAWCIIEADGQRFNFRFTDTRRIPAILKILDSKQRTQIAGPAVRWSYVARNGCWCDIDFAIGGANADIAVEPKLDEHQFSRLVADSQTDELMVLLSDRGHQVFKHPSKSHALLSAGLSAAVSENPGPDVLLERAESLWLDAERRGNKVLCR